MRFWIKSWSKKDHSSPRRGIEPRCPAWQAGILTTILPRNYMRNSPNAFWIKSWSKKDILLILCGHYFSAFAYHFSAVPKVFSNEILNQKKCIHILGVHLNPVSRVTGWDTHHYTTEELHVSISLWTVFHQMWFWTKSWSKKDHSSPRRGIEFRVSSVRVGDAHHYITEELR